MRHCRREISKFEGNRNYINETQKNKTNSEKNITSCRRNSSDLRWKNWVPEEEKKNGINIGRNNGPKLSKPDEKYNSQIQKSSTNLKHKYMKKTIAHNEEKTIGTASEKETHCD